MAAKPRTNAVNEDKIWKRRLGVEEVAVPRYDHIELPWVEAAAKRTQPLQLSSQRASMSADDIMAALEAGGVLPSSPGASFTSRQARAHQTLRCGEVNIPSGPTERWGSHDKCVEKGGSRIKKLDASLRSSTGSIATPWPRGPPLRSGNSTGTSPFPTHSHSHAAWLYQSSSTGGRIGSPLSPLAAGSYSPRGAAAASTAHPPAPTTKAQDATHTTTTTSGRSPSGPMSSWGVSSSGGGGAASQVLGGGQRPGTNAGDYVLMERLVKTEAQLLQERARTDALRHALHAATHPAVSCTASTLWHPTPRPLP